MTVLIPGLYERQDGLSLTDLSFPMLATAFAAALLASLIGKIFIDIKPILANVLFYPQARL